jgi:hypothetical protein
MKYLFYLIGTIFFILCIFSMTDTWREAAANVMDKSCENYGGVKWVEYGIWSYGFGCEK